MIGQMLDRFRVVAQLGEGGMGAVYEALDALNKAVQGRASYPQAWGRLGEVALELEKNDDAANAAEKALKDEPSNASWLAVLAEARVRQKRWTDALTAANSALSASPTHGRAKFAQADALAATGDIDAASVAQRAADKAEMSRGGGPALAPGPYLELTVADDGVGMDEAVRARVFEPFFTTKGVGKGTGLGLAMVYGMVRQSGGAVAVDSAPGHGARFHIYLPAHAADDTAEPTRPIPVVARGSGAVLVIEDEPALRNVIRRVLTAAGYQVAVAADASEARLLAGRLGERLRLVLSDVILPGANGPTIVAELRQAVPDLAVIFMSGYTDDALARFGMAERDFLRKPFDLKLLTARVRQALDAVQPRRP